MSLRGVPEILEKEACPVIFGYEKESPKLEAILVHTLFFSAFQKLSHASKLVQELDLDWWRRGLKKGVDVISLFNNNLKCSDITVRKMQNNYQDQFLITEKSMN